ncbi:membrane hypothetical protein [Mesorhizobium sp. SOD10]|nr:membrane hypothetical protein [Mesorhizobium sp. SOD10]
MMSGVEKRKKFAVILIVVSIFQICLFLFISGIPSYVREPDGAIYFTKAFLVIFPQSMIMVVISGLIYMSSPWSSIYYIYFVIWLISFIGGNLWTAFITDFFNIFELIK